MNAYQPNIPLEDIRRLCSNLDYSEALLVQATPEMVKSACRDALRLKYAAVPVFPCYIPLVASELAGSGIAPQCVVGFPSGAESTAIKAAIAKQGLKDGAREFDMVINVGRLLAKDYDYVVADVRAVVEIAHDAGITVKGIIETGFLTDADKLAAVECLVKAKADFVKTCTGFAVGRATVHDIRLLRDAAAGRIRVKASGSVTTIEDGLTMMSEGADRVAGRGPITAQLAAMGITEL